MVVHEANSQLQASVGRLSTRLGSDGVCGVGVLFQVERGSTLGGAGARETSGARSPVSLDLWFGGRRILSLLRPILEIRAGTTDLVCYGVINAKSVRLDPPVEAVHPAANYCFNVAPAKTTTYTLTADGKAGGTAKETLTITVQ